MVEGWRKDKFKRNKRVEVTELDSLAVLGEECRTSFRENV